MKKTEISEITQRLITFSKNLDSDHGQIGNSKLILAFADMISVLAWTSDEQSQYSLKMVRLTQAIAALTVMLLFGLIVQIYLAQKQYELADKSSIGERIQQAQMRLQAEDFCRTNPEAEESGLYYEDGSMAPCSFLLKN